MRYDLHLAARVSKSQTVCCDWVGTTERVQSASTCGERDSVLPVGWQWNSTRVLRIVANHGSAGFFAYLLFVINQLIFARKHRLVPIVSLEACTVNGHDHYASGARNLYYDARHGPNIWDYFFEPVASLPPNLDVSEVITLPSAMQWRLHHQAKSSVYAHYYGRFAQKRHSGYDASWYLKMRRRAHAALNQYVRVKASIRSKVDTFWAANLAHRQPVLGIHARGTDKQPEIAGAVVHPQQYVRHVDAYLAIHPNATIFVATDSPTFLRWLEHKYPSLVARDALRSDRNAFLDVSLRDNFRKGTDALIDALLLSRCDFLLKCSSALGEFALYFNPALHTRSIDVQFDGSTLDIMARGSGHAHTEQHTENPAAGSNTEQADNQAAGSQDCATSIAGCLALIGESSCTLVAKTDICSTLINCEASPGKSATSADCQPVHAPASQVTLRQRRQLEAVGVFRAVYSSLAARLPQWQRPTLGAVRSTSSYGCGRVVDLVIPRCCNSVLNFVFASLARVPAHLCMRVFVYEFCTSSPAHSSLDSRDTLAGVWRVPRGSPLSLEALSLGHAAVSARFTNTTPELTWFLPLIEHQNSSDELLGCMDSDQFWTAAETSSSLTAVAGKALRVSKIQLLSLVSAKSFRHLTRAATRVECDPQRMSRQRRGKLLRAAGVALLRSVSRVGRKILQAQEVGATKLAQPVPWSPPQLHLSCLEPDYMMYNRQLLPGYWPVLQPCKTHWLQNASARLQRALRRLHSGRFCATKLQTRLLPAGWFSTVAGLVKPAMHAVRTGRGLLTPALSEFTSSQACPRRDLACFFKPLSPGCGKISTNASNTNIIDLHDDQFIRSEAYEVHGVSVIPARYQPLGWFWWVGQILRFLLRPTSKLEMAVRRALRDTGLGEALASQTTVLGLHIRHGDSCLRAEQRRMARTCTPLAEYMQVAGPQAHRLGASVIYLATDSETVLDETRDFPEFRFIHLSDVTRYGRQHPAPNVTWDTLVSQRAHTMDSHQSYIDAWQATVDMLLLSRCHMFVGKFTSTFFRSAYSLHSARCDCAAPFISLDAPWCFDYGVRAGANWEFPVTTDAGRVTDNRFWC